MSHLMFIKSGSTAAIVELDATDVLAFFGPRDDTLVLIEVLDPANDNGLKPEASGLSPGGNPSPPNLSR